MANYFINHYGEAAQFKKLAEELIELLIALIRAKKISVIDTIKIFWKKRKSSDIHEEMADVGNLLEQFSEHYNDARYFIIKTQKRGRQIERIKKEKEQQQNGTHKKFKR